MSWASEFYATKTVVITGGTSGIGQGIGRAFADAGAVVHVTGATQAEVETGAAVEPRFRYTQLDVRNSEQVAEYAATFGSVSALVNCAGVNLRAAEHTVDGFATVIDINLNGSMRTAYAFKEDLSGFGKVYEYRFNTGELKDPLVDIAQQNGWGWKGVAFGKL